jgi:hypothetical protein
MTFYKKALLVLIVIILGYVLWKQIQLRGGLWAKNEGTKNEGTKNEGFTFFTSPDTELASLKKEANAKIQNVNVKYYKLPIKEYCIKASYNTAYTGKYINTDMVKYIISRGTRFLDFEVYMVDGKPCVGFSTDEDYTTLDTQNSILLDSVFNVIMTNAFTSLGCPNNADPLFINLRIKSDDPTVYKEVAKVVEVTLKPKLHVRPVTKETQLANLLGKVVLMVDKTINYEYKKLTSCKPNERNCIDLASYIALETGSEDLFLVNHKDLEKQNTVPIRILNDNIHTSIQNMRFIRPNYDTTKEENPKLGELIQGFGTQIVPYCFYHPDAELTEYEAFFDDHKTAFVTLSNALKYIERGNKVKP